MFLALAALALASILIHAIVGRGRDADSERKGAQFLGGAGDFLLHWFMWLITPVEALLLRAGWTPETLNFTGLAFGLASGTLLALGQLEAGGWALALGGICDILDGRIARARGLESKYGKFLDSTLDRFVEAFVFLGLLVYLNDFAVGPFFAGTAIAGSLLVSYTRARGESVGVDFKGGLMQRGERLVLIFFACSLDGAVTTRLGRPAGTVVLWVVGLIAVATFATAIYRTAWIAIRLRGQS